MLERSDKKKLKKIQASESEEEEGENLFLVWPNFNVYFCLDIYFKKFVDDEEKLREELKDLIDDNPIDEESDGEDSDASGGSKKRKKSDDEDFDDRLEDEDYDLIEENLGVKVERVSITFFFCFKYSAMKYILKHFYNLFIFLSF